MADSSQMSWLVHVTTILSSLHYSALSRFDIIPNLEMICPDVKTRRFPAWVYKSNAMSPVGMFVDYLVRKLLSMFIPVDMGPSPVADLAASGRSEQFVAQVELAWSRFCDPQVHFKDMMSDLNLLAGLHYDNQAPIPSTEIVSFIKKGWVFLKDLQARFADCAGSEVTFGAELKHQHIFGHPDIIGMANGKRFIIDIKTSSGFKSIRQHAFMQIIAYAALSRVSGVDVDLVGIYLPLQCQLMWFDIAAWDLTSYLNVLLYVSRPPPLTDSALFNVVQYVSQLNSMTYCQAAGIGSHFSRSGTTLPGAISRFIDSLGNVPGQVFIYPRNGSKFKDDEVPEPKITDEEYKLARTFIDLNDLRIFIHAPYVINLSNPYTSHNSTSDTYVINLLRNNLIKGTIMGAKGVVVHVGKRLNNTMEYALDRMEQSIRAVLDAATPECPLLLETPAGEATETLTTKEQLLDFYNRFSADDQIRFKICIDTCHIFAAGHLPHEYVEFWLNKAPEAVALIHFNDSKEALASGIDRHASIGTGHIDPSYLYQVAEMCAARNIPMVRE